MITRDGFQDTDEELGWVSDDPDSRQLLVFIHACERDGYEPCPANHAPGLPGWDYAFWGPLAYRKRWSLWRRLVAWLSGEDRVFQRTTVEDDIPL